VRFESLFVWLQRASCDTDWATASSSRSDSESPEEFEALHNLFRRGDILGVTGQPMRTKRSELSISPKSCVLLSPNLHQLPKEHFGFKDQEQRHRKRYLDLIMNQDRREVFIKRARIINYVRKFLDNLGFLEVRGLFFAF
jgi:lysyl-tRNA synthetase class 2